MDISNPRLFPKNSKEAAALQKEMALQVICKDQFHMPLHKIAGVDVSANRFDPDQMIFAAISVFSYPDLYKEEVVSLAERQPFPYIPGLLGFREAPLLVKAYEKLLVKPDLLLVDGQGISHPRKFGIASHLGVLLDIPTIGVAKSILVGKIEGELSKEVGSQAPLVWKGEVLGMAVRSKKNCLPLIISTGHRVSLKTALEIVLSSQKGYRLPEPTRLAHIEANLCRKRYFSSNLK